MSITINWEDLTTGPAGEDLALQIRDFIHQKFQQTQLPRFIRSVEIHTFDFGPQSPEVTIKDITDPLPYFYDDSSSEDEDEGEEEPAHATQASMMQPPKPGQISTTQPPHPRSTIPESPNPLFFPRTPTPGIPGGTSNRSSYFHLPLSAGLSGTTTPAPFAHPFHHHNRPPSPPRTALTHLDVDPTSPGIGAEAGIDDAQAHYEEGGEGRNPLDLQVVLHMRYEGDVALSLTAEILLDYPMPSFVGIPLKIRITGVRFDGVGLLAYLQGKKNHSSGEEREEGQGDGGGEGEGEVQRKVKFAFLAPEDARIMVDERGNLSNHEDGEDGGEDALNEGREKEAERLHKDRGKRFGGLLEEIRVESEIGRQQDGKQVLKNVGKVERFVLEQVRRIFEEEFVWPSSWTFLV